MFVFGIRHEAKEISRKKGGVEVQIKEGKRNKGEIKRNIGTFKEIKRK